MSSNSKIKAWAASGPKEKLQRFEYDPGDLLPDEIEIKVEYCGICHSDLSVLGNEWGNSIYPFVPGHEAVGKVIAVGENSRIHKVGDRVGIGWNADSCMHCRFCMSGEHHLCKDAQATIIGHHGGFSDRLRSHWMWAIPLPDALDETSAGPLLCGGITVFSPFVKFNVKPTDRVGIVGIGGLGHMAIKFAKAWGCEITAFTSSESKHAEAKSFGAHHVVSSQNTEDLKRISKTLDMLLVTVNVPLDWGAMMGTLSPKGRMHVVGAVVKPMRINAFDLISYERSISGSPTGDPVTISSMLEFSARHKISPQVEHFPMKNVNDALEHLESGKARYRIVLDADF